MPTQQLHVVFATDDNYAVGAAVAGNSVRIGLRGRSCDLAFHVVDSGLTPAGRDYLTRALGRAGTVTVHAVADHLQLTHAASHAFGHWSSATLGRLHLGDVLPDDVRRAVYLDADVLVLGDLTEFHALDLGGNGIGACLDQVTPQRSMVLGERVTVRDHGARSPGYFNAGVLLVDMDVWRRRRITERATEIFRRYGTDLGYVDQDVLNYLFSGRWTRLPGHWNRLVAHDGAADGGREEHLTRREGVLHFNGVKKPWRDDYPDVALRRLYVEYQQASALPPPPTRPEVASPAG